MSKIDFLTDFLLIIASVFVFLIMRLLSDQVNVK